MAIQSVYINVSDVGASVAFYVEHLGAVPLHVDEHGAELDAVTATLRLVRTDTPDATTWIADDLQAGFRHIGFKVADIDARVAALKLAGVRFHLEPIDAEGKVRITFFYDPDGTLVELVEGPLQYHEVYSQEDVDADWAMGTPDRPRFDHIGETVHDIDATREYFGALGFTLMSGIHQAWDERGFEINYFRSGNSSLEVFTFDKAEKVMRAPQLEAPGFAAVEFDGELPEQAIPVGARFGVEFAMDADGLVHTATPR